MDRVSEVEGCQLCLVFFTDTFPPLLSTLLFANLEFTHLWLSVP